MPPPWETARRVLGEVGLLVWPQLPPRLFRLRALWQASGERRAAISSSRGTPFPPVLGLVRPSHGAFLGISPDCFLLCRKARGPQRRGRESARRKVGLAWSRPDALPPGKLVRWRPFASSATHAGHGARGCRGQHAAGSHGPASGKHAPVGSSSQGVSPSSAAASARRRGAQPCPLDGPLARRARSVGRRSGLSSASRAAQETFRRRRTSPEFRAWPRRT
jgi:hypothetical protein